MSIEKPFFSIGITTYNRPEMLKKVLISLLKQKFSDFEIIVGNDYLDQPIDNEILGISDHRLRIVNNSVNLGELGNMNNLLSLANGRYFSWIFDDDLCDPNYLEYIYEAANLNNFPRSIYCSFFYIYGDKMFQRSSGNSKRNKLFTGREFLRSYLSGKLQTLGLGCFRDIEYLRKIGGASKLTEGRMALYSEYYLIVQDGLLDVVGYIDSELLGNRVHDESFSSKSINFELYKEAGINLFEKSLNIFSADSLKNDFEYNAKSLLKSIISVVITKTRLAGKRISSTDLNNYVSSLTNSIKSNVSTELLIPALSSLKKARMQVMFYRLKAEIKALLPLRYLHLAHFAQHYLSKYTNKSF